MNRFIVALIGVLIGAGLMAAALLPWSSGGDESVQESWQLFIDGLNRAQSGLTDPKRFPAPVTDRNVAEGHRYMLAHLSRMIEMEMRQDPRYPEFNRSMDMLRKWTGENPDTMYLKAPIDGTGYYKVTAQAEDVAQWADSSRNLAQRQAPRMVTFATITDVPGSTGGLAEMANCKNQTLDFVTSFDLLLDGDGFELLIGPERPVDYQGNFLLSRKIMECPSTGDSTEREAKFLSVREIFSDWQTEHALDMEIVRLDAIGESRPPIESAFIASKLRKIGEELPNQVFFWQLLQEVALEVYRDINLDGKRSMPLNGINQPAPPFTAGGVAGAKQLYAAGNFELEDDQALVVKVMAPVEPHYISFQLSNLWFEGPDQQNYVSSLTGYQLPVSSDGSRYYIVAHQDPGCRVGSIPPGLKKAPMPCALFFGRIPRAP